MVTYNGVPGVPSRVRSHRTASVTGSESTVTPTRIETLNEDGQMMDTLGKNWFLSVFFFFFLRWLKLLPL